MNSVQKPQVCGDCVHCGAGPNIRVDVLSRVCYRHPPTALGVVTAQGLVVASVRPEIRLDTPACGEYEEPDDGSLHIAPGMPS